MTRRERKEARLEKRLDWAQGRDAKSAAAFDAARRVADGIPLGQPILVGHHSEKRHRKDIARIDNGMRKGVESADMATHHRSVAGGIEHQLATSIFSDDPDAVEALGEKIARLEARQESMVKVNAAWRKAGKPKADNGEAWAKIADLLGCTPEALKDTRMSMARDFIERAPFTYQLSNNKGNIARLKGRVTSIEAQHERTAEAEAAPNGVTAQYSGGTRFFAEPQADGKKWSEDPRMYVSVTFAEKPEREILNALRAADFRWGAGYWSGKTENLPASVAAMLPVPAGEVVASREEVATDG